MEPKIEVAWSELAAAFTEWERLFREDPKKFMADAERLKLSEMTLGDSRATYLIELLGKA